MPKLLTLADRDLLLPRMVAINEDFYELVTGDTWTTLVADSGTAVTVNDAAGGTITLSTSATDNDEVAVKTTKEVFLFAADKPLRIAGRLKYSEAATDDANVYFGTMNALAADSMVDDGAGPKANCSAVGFFKVDGGLNWQVLASLGTTQTKVELTAANSLDKVAHVAGSTAYQELVIEVLPKTSTKADICYFIDGVPVYKITDWTFTSATEMNLGIYVKAGGATDETLTVDYIQGHQLR
jgi:hypothetical protein